MEQPHLTAVLWGGPEDGALVPVPRGPLPLIVRAQRTQHGELVPWWGMVAERAAWASQVYDRVPLELATRLARPVPRQVVYVHRLLVDRWAARGPL